MPGNMAFKVLGRLAESSPELLSDVAAENTVGVCARAVVSVIDCAASIYVYACESARTERMREHADKEASALRERNEAYARHSDRILNAERQKSHERLQQLRTEIEQDLERFKKEFAYSRARLHSALEMEEKRQEIYGRLRSRVKRAIDEVQEQKRAFLKNPDTYPSSMMPDLEEKLRLAMTSYNSLTKMLV